jgi:pyruvate,water dikinase
VTGDAPLAPDYFPGFAGLAGLPVRYPATDAVRPLGPEDDGRSWQLDFHYPTGLHPLSHVLLGGLLEGSTGAAASVPVAASRGLVCRTVGPHVYTAGIDVGSPDERAERAVAAVTELAGYPDRFRNEWSESVAELDARYAALQIPAGTDRNALAARFDEAVALSARGWRLHFDVMYRLLAISAHFAAVCAALGIPDEESIALLAAGPSTIRDTDLALAALADDARARGLDLVFEKSEDDELLATLRDEPVARPWLARFGAFLDRYGHRNDAVLDVGTPSWREDPSRPLRIIRSWLLEERRVPDVADRDAAVATVRDRLRPADRRLFDAALETARSANFTWWNEEHNAQIDLRLHLPVRALARTVAAAFGGLPDDAVHLFAEEVHALATGALTWSDLTDVVAERRVWREGWQARRAGLARTVGAADGVVLDPVMCHIIGTGRRVAGPRTGLTLVGRAASAGVARGRARVVVTPEDLYRLEPGDVLICEATSPSWTPAFVTLAACVCDSGGTLTHAAIICREYGLPCVCAVGVATRTIHDGDLVEVDGSAGTVTVLQPG